jgi:predicted permease
MMSGNSRTTELSLDGRPPAADAGNRLDVRVNVVTPGYLEALAIPLLAGRAFTAADTPSSPRVAIVSRALANRLWPGADPIGRTLTDGRDNAATVVGMVPDAVYGDVLERDAPPFFYVPLAQSYESGVTLHVRPAAGDPLGLLPAVRRVVREADARLVVNGPLRLREIFNRSIAQERMMAILVGLFSAIALLLAAIGVYGVMSHLASERTAEIGIRLALGARPFTILSLVAADGIRLLAIGGALGLAAAIAGRRYVESQLFGVTPADPLTLVTACALLAAIGLVACLIPARRAMRVDPIVALRVRG